ncbi:hypothetical protein [Altericista sp. CCNU0014]|uniref:hypothetical protein n=1 Tax=Altericista sp. CCNU0014 TaxID=3082949 RepID=UPI00384A6282
MSEDSTTPHESDSHASDRPEEAEAAGESTAEVAASTPLTSETLASESTPARATAPEASAKRPRESIPVAVEVSGTQQTFNKVLKLAKDAWVKVQPVLKEKSIQALLVANRWTEHFLDETWPKLSSLAIAKVPSSTKMKVQEQKVKLQPTLDKLKPLWEKVAVPFWQKLVVPTWNKGLAFLRQRLPENLQALTDRFLTVAIVTAAIAIYWFFSSLTSGKPAAAKQPPVPTKPVLTRPAPQPVAQRPTIKPTIKPTIRPTSAPSAIEPAPVAPSPRPVAPAAQPIVTEAPRIAPVPTLDLAEIQTQLESAVTGMGEGLIASIKTADADRTLKVSLGTAWDGLSRTDREKVAQKLWERSQKTPFKRFELLDDANTLVARSPVVGSNVIFLQPPTSASAT